jgi:hypothetical protein
MSWGLSLKGFTEPNMRLKSPRTVPVWQTINKREAKQCNHIKQATHRRKSSALSTMTRHVDQRETENLKDNTQKEA